MHLRFTTRLVWVQPLAAAEDTGLRGISDDHFKDVNASLFLFFRQSSCNGRHQDILYCGTPQITLALPPGQLSLLTLINPCPFPNATNAAPSPRLLFLTSQEHKIRETMVSAMRAEFGDLDLTFSIGGQISFDLFPTVSMCGTVKTRTARQSLKCFSTCCLLH